jgi:hypothetical protein
MSWHQRILFLLALLLIVFAVSLICIFLFIPNCLQIIPAFRDTSVNEYEKLTFQFLLFSVLGGLAAFVYSWQKDNEIKWVEHKWQISELQRSVVAAYNSVKLCRRRLRWAAKKFGRRSYGKINAATFDEIMLEIETQQLIFESFKKQMILEVDYISDKNIKSELQKKFKQMEEYINKICQEWENDVHRKFGDFYQIGIDTYMESFIASNDEVVYTSTTKDPEFEFFGNMDDIIDKLCKAQASHSLLSQFNFRRFSWLPSLTK